MKTGRECACCKDNDQLLEVSDGEFKCFSEHEGFQGNCLNDLLCRHLFVPILKTLHLWIKQSLHMKHTVSLPTEILHG